MTNAVSKSVPFFTPVLGDGWKSAVDRCFVLGDQVVDVIDTKCIKGEILTYQRKEKLSTLQKVIRIALALVCLPLLPVKVAIRLTHPYKLAKPQRLIAEADRIPESLFPKEKEANSERKKRLLTIAYLVCMRDWQQVEKGRDIPKELAFSVGEVLSKYARLQEGSSEQLQLGALNALLYAAGATANCFDFASYSPKNLKALAEEWQRTGLFTSTGATFGGLSNADIYQKLSENRWTLDQRIVLSQTLRQNPTSKKVELAEKCLQDDVNLDVLREHWELRYETSFGGHIDWLYEAAKKMPKSYLQDLGRLAIKQNIDVGYRRSLKEAMEALLPHLDAESYAQLENILAGSSCNSLPVAKKLMALDPTGRQLNIASFAILLSKVNHSDSAMEKGHLRLARELVDLYEKKGIVYEPFAEIKLHYTQFHLRQTADEMQKSLATEGSKLTSTLDRHAVSITQLKKWLLALLKPLEGMKVLKPTENRYPEGINEVRQLFGEASKSDRNNALALVQRGVALANRLKTC